MALRAIMLRRQIEAKRGQLEQLREKDAAFAERRTALETAVNEAETDEQFEAVRAEIETLEGEETAHGGEVTRLSGEIQELEEQLAEAERGRQVPQAPEGERRTNTMSFDIRALPMSRRAFDALPMEQRTAILAQEDVKTFLGQLRSMRGQSRALTGGELTIPVVMLDLIAENMYRYSKLLNRVRVRNVNGEARQTIAGTVPEAVWTEMCGAINELTFGFNQITLDGYKVAGYIAVCNALLEDNDVNLASWIVEMISESIGLAIDKAILYGKGAASKMPLGIVTRLAQSSKPADYPANAPTWTDLHTSNIVKVDNTKTGAEFWAALMIAAGNTFTRYSRGEQFWAMNSKTYALLRSKVITFTASGDIVSNVFGTLPIINGPIDVLEFIPDGDIIGGYGDLYLFAERSGMVIESSREVQFIQDNTVFRGKQRCDGAPIIPGAFVAMNINGNSVTTAMDFPADTANDADLQSLTGLTLSPAFDAGTLSYTATAPTSAAPIEATPTNADAQIGITYNGKNLNNGATPTYATGSLPMVVTVKNGNAVKVYTITVTKS